VTEGADRRSGLTEFHTDGTREKACNAKYEATKSRKADDKRSCLAGLTV